MERVRTRRLAFVRVEAGRLRRENRRLLEQLDAVRGAMAQAQRQRADLQEQLQAARQRVARLEAELDALRRAPNAPPAGTPQTASGPAAPPAFVKANVPQEAQRRPGRKAGHAPAHRLPALRVDVHVEVPLPRDTHGQASCPACHTQLRGVKTHQRIVEDLVPAQRLVTCYHTASGYCPHCRKQVESRAARQPPAPPGVDLPQGQLGPGALATAALLRLVYRLPFRQIVQLFADLPGLTLSAGGVARQIQRMARQLRRQYDALQTAIRGSGAVYADETSWRINGQNRWLWTLHTRGQTLYHIAKGRGGKVLKGLLGEAFGGTLVSDFLSAYNALDCPKQKCLAHLARELAKTAAAHRAFATGRFYRRARRLVQLMLALGKQRTILSPERYQKKVAKLERRIVELGRGPAGGWTERHARRISQRFGRHGTALTRFLHDPQVDATNNAAERALRPAVVARKISGGSRSETGAAATAVLLSVLKTAQQQGRPLLETFQTLLLTSWSGTTSDLLAPSLAATA